MPFVSKLPNRRCDPDRDGLFKINPKSDKVVIDPRPQGWSVRLTEI